MSDVRETEDAELDRHRAIVRDIHNRLASAYGVGGTGVLVAVAGVFFVRWWMAGLGGLLSVATWIFAVTVGLVALFVARSLIYRRVDSLADRLESYCEANDISPKALRERFGGEDLYPFFDALFDVRERRDELES